MTPVAAIRFFLASAAIYIGHESALGQNLVPNFSFESYTQEPCNWTELGNVSAFYTHVLDWSLPNEGTSDIYSVLNSPECWAHMPNSNFSNGQNYPLGSQLPHSGNRFAGIFTYSGGIWGGEPPYREYLQVELTSPLVAGKEYCAEMYVSLAENPRYASNLLGFYFRDQRTMTSEFSGSYANRGFKLPFVPQIVEQNVIVDSVDWTRVSGKVVANGTEQFVIIGNFSSDYETTGIDRGGDSRLFEFNYSYYYIDDVSVELLPIPKLLVNSKYEVCEGDEIEIVADTNLKDIEWVRGSSVNNVIAVGPKFRVRPVASDSYIVRGRTCNDTVSAQFNIAVNPKPVISLGNDIVGCPGQVIELDAGSGYDSYEWNDGSRTRTVVASKSGSYSVEVENEFECKSSDTLGVLIKALPSVHLGADTLVCKTLLVSGGDGEYNYVWSNGSLESSTKVDQSGYLKVSKSNECGTAEDEIFVTIQSDLFYPNVITPNNDGANDNLILSTLDGISRDEAPVLPSRPVLEVFNRWGMQVYRSDKYSDSWPGPGDIEDLKSGIYYYTVKFGKCSIRKEWLQILK